MKFELKKDSILRDKNNSQEEINVSFSEERDHQNNFNQESGAKIFTALDQDTGQEAGSIKYDYPDISDAEKFIRIRGIGLADDNYKGKGVGLKLYEELIKRAQEKNLTGIRSDAVVQGGALVVWKKLQEAGYAVKINDDSKNEWKNFLQVYNEGKYYKNFISTKDTRDSVFKLNIGKVEV